MPTHKYLKATVTMNKTKMKPILFSTPMVQAILAGQKTQTRRVMKPQTTDEWIEAGIYPDGKPITPRYQIGDTLWVRETWHPKRHNMPTGLPYEYRATAKEDGNPTDEPWKPSIFMPREACRIFLEVTNVRVERLHDISEEDAIAEGVITLCLPKIGMAGDKIWNEDDYPTDHYRRLWEKINGKGSWDLNPWVWVIEFKRLIH